MTLSLTFSQSFFEQNVSVPLKLLRFSAIFVTSKQSQKCGTFWKKCGNAGIKPKCEISRTISGRLTPMMLNAFHNSGSKHLYAVGLRIMYIVRWNVCHWPRGLMDKASDFESEDCGFEHRV